MEAAKREALRQAKARLHRPAVFSRPGFVRGVGIPPRARRLPPPPVPALRRLRAALDDPAPLAGAARRRGARRARALPRVADAAPPGADAALVSDGGL